MDAEPGASVRRMKDSSARALRRAGAGRAGLRDDLRRQHRCHHGQCAAAHGADPRRVNRPAIATVIPVPGTTPTVLLDAGANSECQPDWLVQFAQMGAVFARLRSASTPPGRAALHRRGAGQGARRWSRRPTSSWLPAPPGRRRRPLRRQRRGPRHHDRRRRRGGDRRLHGQRGAQDPRGRHAHPCGRHPRGLRARTPRPRPRPTCSHRRSSRSTGVDPDNTGGAMLLGVRRPVPHLARLVQRLGHRQRGAGRRRDARGRASWTPHAAGVDHLSRRSRKRTIPCGAVRSAAGPRAARLTPTDALEETSVPAETHVAQGPHRPRAGVRAHP
jgi:hypothetical protein